MLIKVLIKHLYLVHILFCSILLGVFREMIKKLCYQLLLRKIKKLGEIEVKNSVEFNFFPFSEKKSEEKRKRSQNFQNMEKISLNNDKTW